MDRAELLIRSRDYWFKIVDFLQQNWMLIDESLQGVVVWVISDTSGVFDKLNFTNAGEAEMALRRNGFNRYADDVKSQEFLRPPAPPFWRTSHPNGPIYSSGRFWR